MIDKIFEYIEKYNMLEKGDTVIAGISGGADSVCLLFVLLELESVLGIRIVAVHVNHGIRGADADADEAFTVKLCQKHGVKCVVYHKDVPKAAKMRGQSVEEAGRNVRREAFEEVFQAEGGSKIATAHHQNDNAETFLLNLARGSGLKGLAGIPPVNGKFIHPLLCLTKKEIEAYVAGLGCGWREDATNGDEDYTRNLIRQRVIPVLEERVNSAAAAHINEAAQKIRQAFEYMKSEADAALLRCVSYLPDQTIRINEKPFAECAEAIQGMIAMEALSRAAGASKDIGAVHAQAVVRLFSSQCGRAIDLPYGIRAKRDYEGVALCRKPGQPHASAENAPVKLAIPGETFIPRENLRVSARLFEKPEGFSEDKIPECAYTKWFDYDIIKGGLFMRYRRAGDSIVIGGSGGRQKLKSYFVNEKIPEEKRGAIPLLADDDGVLWIVGHRISSAYKVTQGTKKILEIKLSEGKEDAGEG